MRSRVRFRNTRSETARAELYYLADNDTLVAVPVVERGGSLVPGLPVPIFPVRPVRYTSRNSFAVSHDGSRFVINERIEISAPRAIKVRVIGSRKSNSPTGHSERRDCGRKLMREQAPSALPR